MVEINVVYTKTGDDGKTSLTTDSRLLKSCPRIEAIGAVDELNSHLGLLIAHINNDNTALTAELSEIQNQLFNLGSCIAFDKKNKAITPPKITEDNIKMLEHQIDKMDNVLPTLQNFILPSGHPDVSKCHIARTVCRRAERNLVALKQQEDVDPLHLKYLNRLSDYLFVLARYILMENNIPAIEWQKN